MLSVPGVDIPRRLTNSVLRRLSAALFGLVCTQQMDRTYGSWLKPNSITLACSELAPNRFGAC